MPTLDVAARQLGISEKTLRKWMRRLEIVATRHPRDWRYQVIADEDVQTIKTARAEMPGASPVRLSAVIPSYSSLAFDRRSTADGDARPSSLPVESLPPTPRPGPPRIAVPKVKSEGDGLPDGMMSVEQAARDHGLSPSTVRNWAKSGELETYVEHFARVNGQFGPNQPLTRRGLRQMCERAQASSVHSVKFHTCLLCPHTDTVDTADDLEV